MEKQNFRKKIPVFFTVDDNYITYMTITLKGIVDHSKKTNRYDIYVVHTGLKRESKQKVLKVARRDNIFVHFYNVSSKLQELQLRLDVRDYYSISTYYRLFLPGLFPLINKAIYIDSDIVIREDIANLYSIDIGDKLLGAIPDGSVQIYDEFKTYVREIIGVEPEKYFNAGVLLMNFKGLRNFKFEKKAISLLSHVTFKVAQDQDVLNYLCKDKIHYIDHKWNVMPLGERVPNPSLVHYNLILKPWKHEGIMYEDYFWDYAEKLGLFLTLMGQLKAIPQELKEQDFKGVEMVKKLCLAEAAKKEEYQARMKGEQKVKKPKLSEEFSFDKMKYPGHEHRQEILDKIKLYELEGKFDQDVEDDPPYKPIEPQGLDFLQRKFSTKMKSAFANWYSFKFFNHRIKKGDIVIDGYKGTEKLKKLRSGAVITANHFSPFDSIPIHKIVKKATRKKLFKIIREGNYSFPGLYGFFMRHCNSIPLASNFEVMKYTLEAVDTVLKRGDLLLVYAEQSMWWNYRKPKPTKIGAYKFAAKNNVPVIPTFITMRDTDKLDVEGFPIQAYTLHILDPIYPDPSLSIKENADFLKSENDKAWKELYEKVYKIPLTYSTKKGS